MSKGDHMRIGITGSMGSGKSTVTQLIEAMGYGILSSDTLVHKAYLKGGALYDVFLAYFGAEIVDDNKVNRALLSQRIFEDSSALKFVETHVFKHVEAVILNDNRDPLFVEAPLLFEAGMANLFDFIICVDAPKSIRIPRLQERGYTTAMIQQREVNQMPIHDKIKASNYVIENDGNICELKHRINYVLEEIGI